MSKEQEHDEESEFYFDLAGNVYEGMRPSTDEEVRRSEEAIEFWEEWELAKKDRRRAKALEIAINAKQRKNREKQENKRLLDD